MGTDPPVNAVDISHTAEVDYAALDSEYRELAAQIKAVGVTPVTPAVQDQLVITAQVLAICPSVSCIRLVRIDACSKTIVPHTSCTYGQCSLTVP